MKSFITLPLLVLFLLSSPLLISSTEANEGINSDDEVEVIALRMYADWCGYCKTLDAKLDAIKPEFQNSGIWFTYFDFTDEFTTSQTKKQAAQLNLSHLFETYEGKTGMLLLIDPETGEVQREITSEIDPNELKELLKSL